MQHSPALKLKERAKIFQRSLPEKTTAREKKRPLSTGKTRNTQRPKGYSLSQL